VDYFLVGTHRALDNGYVQGRITERHLPMADECFPGIQRFYEELDSKPATFLQLVWAFEARRMPQSAPVAKRRRR
jgi:hypothetical protein